MFEMAEIKVEKFEIADVITTSEGGSCEIYNPNCGVDLGFN